MRRIPCLALAAAVLWAGGMGVAHGELGVWTSIGPDSGVIDALAIDPETPTTLYADSYGVGVIKSTDGGDSWSAVNTGLSSPSVHALAIDPVTSTTLYAGSYGEGVIKSTDGGDSWSAVNTGLTSFSVFALAIDPVGPATLYAGTDGGVFKSPNGGGTWGAVNSGLPTGGVAVSHLAIDPVRPATLYATTNGGVFKSTNGGGSWSATGLTDPAVAALAIDSVTPTTLYAGTIRWDGWSWRGYVVKSTDGGGAWSVVLTGASPSDAFALAIDPVTPTTLWAGGGGLGVMKSTDGGGAWSPLNTGLTNLGVQVLALDQAVSPTLYAGTSGGGTFAITMDRVATHARFFTGASLLYVSATSSETPSAQLSVAISGCVPEAAMTRLGNTYFYIKKVTSCGDLKGETVRVASSLGGVATATIK